MKEYILPIRDLVINPGTTVPMLIDNAVSVACVDAAVKNGGHIVLAPQHSSAYPATPDDIFNVGTLCNIAQVLRMPDGTVHIMTHATHAVNMTNITVDDGVFYADVTPIEITDDANAPETLALRDKVADTLLAMTFVRNRFKDKIRTIAEDYPLPAFIDAVVQMININVDTAVQILAMTKWYDKLVALLEQVGLFAATSKIEESINRRITQQMDGGRREAYLQEKIRAIQREMGDDDDDNDAMTMRRRIEKSAMPMDVKEKAMSEWRRMRNMSPMSNDGALIKAYLEELLSMPWDKSDNAPIDLKNARTCLDSDHSGMTAVKERILEHIAVMKKTGTNRGGILCFVGAPGVGKTSLCKSIANALGRKYTRISLGGISDEAHFRGHRKTYIGAQTGRVMDALKRCKTNNPVLVLDEIDKMGRDWRGDPESALLEILDPEQNKTFRDHYLEVDFDLSNVMFIATANTLNLSTALKDRMEIIQIPGYGEDEKVRIAREHLIRRAADDTGWDTDNIIISDDALRHIIREYTGEMGVRQLHRELTAMLRRALLENDGEDAKTEFTIARIDELLAAHRDTNINKRIGFSARI